MKSWLRFVLLVTIILCPLYILRAVVVIPTTLLEWLITLSAVLTAIDYFRSKENVSIFKTNFDIIIVFFLLAAMLATATSANLIGGLGILKAYFFEPVIFYYCLIYSFKKKYITETLVIETLIVTGIWLSFLGLVQKLTGRFSLAPNEIAQGRISAVYNSANSLALFLGPVISLTCSLFLRAVRNKKIIYAAAFIFFTLIMIWTKSRGGVIAELFALVVFVYAIIAERVTLLKRVWVLVPIILISLIVFALYQTVNTYQSVTSGTTQYQGSDTLEIRYYLWAGTVNLLKDHPIFGAGLDGFKTLYGRQYKLPQYQEDFQYPHNFILTFWSETGIYGLIIFLILIVKSFGLLIKNISRRKNSLLSAGLLAALTYLIVHGVVDVPYFKNDLSFEFWLLMALIEYCSVKALNKSS